MDAFSKDEARLAKIKVIFGDYLDSRGYTQEAGNMYLAAGDFESAQEAFLKSLDIRMTFTLGEKRGLDADNMVKLKEDLIERLLNAQRHEDAGDLMDPKADFDGVLDCYLKASAFSKAIQVCMKMGKSELIQTQVR